MCWKYQMILGAWRLSFFGFPVVFAWVIVKGDIGQCVFNIFGRYPVGFFFTVRIVNISKQAVRLKKMVCFSMAVFLFCKAVMPCYCFLLLVCISAWVLIFTGKAVCRVPLFTSVWTLPDSNIVTFLNFHNEPLSIVNVLIIWFSSIQADRSFLRRF